MVGTPLEAGGIGTVVQVGIDAGGEATEGGGDCEREQGG
jgi:hypothetical protein